MERYSDEELLDALRNVTDGEGTGPTMDKMDDTDGQPSSQTIKNRFGTWNDALNEAGLQLNQTQSEGRSGEDYYNTIKSLSSCKNCGEDRSPILTFHHRNQDSKNFPLARDNQRSPESLYNEMKKCIILCKNCHGLHHSDEYEFNANKLPNQEIPKPSEIP